MNTGQVDGPGILDPALALGAHLRLTRLLTKDVMGGYLVVNPLVRLRDRLPTPRRRRAVELVLEGLDCPHCCGLWVAGAVVASRVAVDRSPRLLALWRAGTAALTLGYAGGHISAKVDGGTDDGSAEPVAPTRAVDPVPNHLDGIIAAERPARGSDD